MISRMVTYRPSVYFADVMDRHHVWLVETGCRLSLPAKSLLKLLIVCETQGQHLQGNHPVDPGVVGAPNFSHAATAQQLD